jgi:hypothetical protein
MSVWVTIKRVKDNLNLVGVGHAAATQPGSLYIFCDSAYKRIAKGEGGLSHVIDFRLRGDENIGFDTENEFRQIAILKDPKTKASNVASNSVYTHTVTLQLDVGSTNFEEDEIVYQGQSLSQSTFRAIVLNWNSGTNVINLVDAQGTPVAGILNGDTSKAARTVKFITEQQLKSYTGSLLYINNIKPIQRASDQTDDFKIVISF